MRRAVAAMRRRVDGACNASDAGTLDNRCVSILYCVRQWMALRAHFILQSIVGLYVDVSMMLEMKTRVSG